MFLCSLRYCLKCYFSKGCTSGMFGRWIIPQRLGGQCSGTRHVKHSGDHSVWCTTGQTEEKHQGLDCVVSPNPCCRSLLRRSSSTVRASLLRPNTIKNWSNAGIVVKLIPLTPTYLAVYWDCAAQLRDVLTDIFNSSLSQAVVPTCLKFTTIIPKKSPVSCLNEYHPIAVSPMMKCFERLVMHNIKTSLPNTLNPLQFAYSLIRSRDDAISSTWLLPT